MRPRLLALLFALVGVAVVIVLIDANRNMPLGADADNTTSPGPTSTENGTAQGTTSVTDWHGVQRGAHYSLPSCAQCHWNGGLEFYKPAWTRVQDGWNLTVAPTIPDVALLSVEANTQDITDAPAVLLQQSPWIVGQSWTGTFDAPEQASAMNLVATMRLSSPDPYDALGGTGAVNGTQLRDTAGGTDTGSDLLGSMRLDLVSPTGKHATVTRLEDDTLLVQQSPLELGTWTFTAVVDQAILNGQSLVQQQGGFGADTPLQAVNGALSITFPKTASRSIVAAASYANALGLTVPAAANFHFPSEPDGGPPTVNLLATVYHDHGPQLVTDNIDIFPYTRQFLRQTGPDLSGEPLPKEAIQAAWGDKTQYNLWSVVNDHRAWSYTTDAQGRINGIGNTPFAYVHPEGRLLPGATRLRIDA